MHNALRGMTGNKTPCERDIRGRFGNKTPGGSDNEALCRTGNKTPGAPHLARFSRDVGYHEPQPATLDGKDKNQWLT